MRLCFIRCKMQTENFLLGSERPQSVAGLARHRQSVQQLQALHGWHHSLEAPPSHVVSSPADRLSMQAGRSDGTTHSAVGLHPELFQGTIISKSTVRLPGKSTLSDEEPQPHSWAHIRWLLKHFHWKNWVFVSFAKITLMAPKEKQQCHEHKS